MADVRGWLVSDLLRLLTAKFSTVILQVDHPIHKGQPNPSHGRFFFAGSIPANCYNEDTGRSKTYATQDEAIAAAKAGGAERIQRTDCSFVD